MNNQAMPKGYGFRGWMLILYQALAYVGYTMLNSYATNIFGQFYPAGTTGITFLAMIASLLGWITTYFIISPRIGKIRNQKLASMIFGIVALILGALMLIITPFTATGGINYLWAVIYVLVQIVAPIWANTMTTIMIGNWFPRKKGTVMGIVTIAYPITSAVLLGVFQAAHGAALAQGATLVQANIKAWLPFFIAAAVGIIICGIFVTTYPEECGCFRDNDKSFTKEMADAMLAKELEDRKRSVWKRSKIWACGQWYLSCIPTGLIVLSSVAFMVQIIPALIQFAPQLSIFVVPGFFFMNNPISAVLFLMGIFAIIGSYVLGLIDTKWGVKKAVIITSISIIIMGILGLFANAWTIFIATMLLGVYMGAGSNFGFSMLVRYWRREDFPSVYTGQPPISTVLGAAMPYIFALFASTPWGYHAVFAFMIVIGVICTVLECAFSPKKLAEYDNKLRVEAGLEPDNELLDRVNWEKERNAAKKAAKRA